MRRSRLAVVGLAVVALASVSSCAHSTLTSTTDRPPLRKATITTVPSTTTPSLPSGVPTCLGVVQVPNTRPTISLEGLLFTSTDVPNGYTSVGPQTTGAAGPEFTASFPSTVPVAYISFEMTVHAVGAALSTTYGISETIGEEDSAQVATQLVSQMKGQCPPPQITMTLPGSLPDLIVDGESSEGSRGQGLALARLLTTKGPYVIDIRWSTNTESYAFAAAPPPFPPPEMGLVADEALSHILG